MINSGYIESTLDDRAVVVRIYYDQAAPAGPNQPLVNGPRGYCLDVTNTSGRPRRIAVSNDGQSVTANVGQGNPVTAGQGRSRTAAQLSSLGFTTRGDVADFQIG